MNRTAFSGYIFRSLLVVAGFAALVGVATYFFFSYQPGMQLRTNRYETMMTTKKDMFGWMMEGAGIYFFNQYQPTWKQGVQQTRTHKKEQKKLLHYKLQIEHIIDSDPKTVVNHTRPTIYLHGWGDTKQSAKLLKAFCDVLPGDVITFNFRDNGVILPKLGYSNLGQLPDVLSTIYVIKWTRDNLGVKEVDLFGYSRGGATLLNTIAVLNDKNGRYDTELASIGITQQDRKELLLMIQKGCHVLDCPLTDVNVTMGEFMKSKNSFWVSAFETFTRYKRDGLQGLTSALTFGDLKLTMLMHFQYHDKIVSNKNEAELYSRLARHNPATTFMVLGNNGGHLHSHAALANTIHTFKRSFGSSYDPEYVSQYHQFKNDRLTSNRLLRPGFQAEQVIERYYNECQKDGTVGKKAEKSTHLAATSAA